MNKFDEIYSSIINDNDSLLNNYNKTKEGNKKNNTIANIFFAIVLIVGILIVLKTKFYPILFFIIISSIVLRVLFKAILDYFTGVYKDKNDFSLQYKDKIIKKLIDCLIDNASYSPLKEMDLSIYEESKFESYDEYGRDFNKYDDYKADDYISGSIDNNPIELSNILRQYTYTDSDGDSHTVTLFHGLFGRVILNKKSTVDLRIMSSNYESIKSKVKLDYPLFEKYFNVSSSNDIKALQVLTFDVLDYLVAVREKINMNLDINIDGDTIYFRVHCDDAFEFNNYNKNLYDKELLYKYYLVLAVIKDLTIKLSKIIDI